MLLFDMKETQTVNLASNVVENGENMVAKFFAKLRINLEGFMRMLRIMLRFGESPKLYAYARTLVFRYMHGWMVSFR